MKFILLVCLLTGIAAAGPASAQNYPTRPVRLVIPFAAGSSSNDIIGRALAQRLTQILGQQIVVDNRTGATGSIGSEFAAKSAPDGYTLLLATTGAQSIAPSLGKLGYDVLRDLAPIALVADVPYMMVVNPMLPATNVPEFIALARAQPGKLIFASTGVGGTPHLCLELLKISTKIDVVHSPYKSGAPAITSVIGGETQAMFGGVTAFTQQLKSGRLRAVGTAAPKRLQMFPDTPTFAEQGLKGFEVSSWLGLMAPAKTSPAIIQRLQDATTQALSDREMLTFLAGQGADPASMGSVRFGEYLRAEIARWGKVIRDANVKLDE